MLVLAALGAWLGRREGGVLSFLGVPRERRMLYGAIGGAVVGLILVPLLGLLAWLAYLLVVLLAVVAVIFAVYLVSRLFSRHH